MSDYLFAPTEKSYGILWQEETRGHAWQTGNTIVDAVNEYKPQRERKPSHTLVTIHRKENTDNKARFKRILRAVDNISGLVIWPIHPRARKMLKHFKRKTKAELIEPVKYTTMLGLIYDAITVVTDSGGLQEEACILGTPCITMRDKTERPETVECGANRLIDSSEPWADNWHHPYGDGRSGERILKILSETVPVKKYKEKQE